MSLYFCTLSNHTHKDVVSVFCSLHNHRLQDDIIVFVLFFVFFSTYRSPKTAVSFSSFYATWHRTSPRDQIQDGGPRIRFSHVSHPPTSYMCPAALPAILLKEKWEYFSNLHLSNNLQEIENGSSQWPHLHIPPHPPKKTHSEEKQVSLTPHWGLAWNVLWKTETFIELLRLSTLSSTLNLTLNLTVSLSLLSRTPTLRTHSILYNETHPIFASWIFTIKHYHRGNPL